MVGGRFLEWPWLARADREGLGAGAKLGVLNACCQGKGRALHATTEGYAGRRVWTRAFAGAHESRVMRLSCIWKERLRAGAG